ncbi:TonB-dependent receptor family protein [Azospirillum brasilense]|uniref:TonB-dependent receptor family protein n=1 Tax=Azospirillum brasilense TaxID=192 RepID=UPI000E0B69ED|nr:TonB-dependent receptor [Azospirillum brasilense]
MPCPPLRNLSPPALLAALLTSAAPVAFAQSASAPPVLPPVTVTSESAGSLTVPTTDEAEQLLQRIPGGVELVPDTAFKNGPANTIRDVLGAVPGVITQPKSNVDNRVSIRGSGLTRNYGNRGVNLYMDGIPINTSDGLFDVFEIDPGAYRYVEVYKGANALRYGANTLGGAVNFVTPTGRDAARFDSRVDGGSFGFLKGQASSGGASGAFDYFASLSAQREDGYRDHSDGHMARGNANIGYRIAPEAETRFYVNANTWRQRLPGELTKSAALNAPRSADPDFVSQDQQRNIDSLRIANKMRLRFETTEVEFGVFSHRRHVDHPIYRYLDYTVNDYGGFVRATDERTLAGFRNRLVVGTTIINGALDYKEFENVGNAEKGALVFSTRDKAENYASHIENSFYVLPEVAVVAGLQHLHARRDRTDRFLGDGDQSGRRTYNLWSPRAGLLWDVDPDWQLFANVSRSAEVPTFDANSFASPASSNLKAQTATTYEIGTRGRRPDVTWDLAAYRSHIDNELQCVRTSPYSTCTVRNADRTVHQGVELGLGIAVLKALATPEDRTWLNLTYTYNDFFFDGATYTGNRLPGVPPHTLRAELLYKHPDGFHAGPSVDWMPRPFYADNANSLAVDPYALLNVKVGFDRGTGWSGYLEGRNLLDKTYISSAIIAETATAASALFSPGYGRAIHAGMRLTW